MLRHEPAADGGPFKCAFIILSLPPSVNENHCAFHALCNSR